MGGNDDDETQLVETLAPSEFPTAPLKLQFYWRANFETGVEQQIREKVLDAVSEVAVQSEPSVAVVGRPGLSPTSNTVNVDLFDQSGRSLLPEHCGARNWCDARDDLRIRMIQYYWTYPRSHQIPDLAHRRT